MIQDLIGIPYEKHGRTTKGLDCYGLVHLVYGRLGKELPNFPEDYTELLNIHNAIEENKSKFIELSTVGVDVIVYAAVPFINI